MTSNFEVKDCDDVLDIIVEYIIGNMLNKPLYQKIAQIESHGFMNFVRMISRYSGTFKRNKLVRECVCIYTKFRFKIRLSDLVWHVLELDYDDIFKFMIKNNPYVINLFSGSLHTAKFINARCFRVLFENPDAKNYCEKYSSYLLQSYIMIHFNKMVNITNVVRVMIDLKMTSAERAISALINSNIEIVDEEYIIGLIKDYDVQYSGNLMSLMCQYRDDILKYFFSIQKSPEDIAALFMKSVYEMHIDTLKWIVETYNIADLVKESDNVWSRSHQCIVYLMQNGIMAKSQKSFEHLIYRTDRNSKDIPIELIEELIKNVDCSLCLISSFIIARKSTTTAKALIKIALSGKICDKCRDLDLRFV